MTNEEAIKYLRQLYPQGGHCWLDEQRSEAISMAIESLSHPVTKKSDQVERIRSETERLKSNLIHGACASQIAMETRCKEEAYNEVLAILDS